MCQTSTSVNAANTLTNTTAGVAAAPSGNTSAPIHDKNINEIKLMLKIKAKSESKLIIITGLTIYTKLLAIPIYN